MNNKNLDLTSVRGVIDLMKSSASQQEWSDSCDAVKVANNGDYHSFWFVAVILSGVLDNARRNWTK